MSTRLLLWAAAAGALIPVMAVLNSRLGKAIGEGLHAPVVLFSIGLLFCLVVSWIATKSFPNPQEFGSIKPIEYLGGIIVGFYVISATLLAPRIGVANFIVCAVTAQIVISLLIDHFGLFGATARPVTTVKLLGVALLLGGLALTQLAEAKSVRQ
mgnify:FL=1